MLDTQIKVKTDYFDGPLALLLLLVQKEEMDVRKLDLTAITKQYLDYLSQMKELNFDVAGDYLYLAATLLLLKSNSCISEEEQDNLQANFENGDLVITSHAELVRRLEELQHFQKMSKLLWKLPKQGHEIFVKPKINRKEIVNSILTPMDLGQLTLAMIDFIKKENRKYTVVKRDRLSIKEKLITLKNHLKEGEKTDFDSLVDLEGEKSLDNIVITFISILELARLKRVQIFQNEMGSKIYVDVVASLQDFDVNMADGFEEEDDIEKDVATDEEGQALIQPVVSEGEENITLNNETLQ